MFLGVGKVISLGNYDFDYSEFSLSFFFVVCLVFHLSKLIHWRKESFTWFLLIEIVMICGLLLRLFSKETILGTDHSLVTDDVFIRGASLVNIQVTSYSFISWIKISMFLYSMVCLVNYVSKKDFVFLMQKMYIPCVVTIFLGIFEFFFINLINPQVLRKFVLLCLGSSKEMVITPYYRAGIYSILLSYMEPSSVCFGMLCIASVMMFDFSVSKNMKYRKKTAFFIFLSCLLSLSTLAMTGIVMCGFVLVVFLIFLFQRRDWLRLLSVFIIVFGAIFVISFSRSFIDYLSSRISVLSDFIDLYKTDSTNPNIFSYRESLVYRLYSILNAFNIFIHHPLFGIGTGTSTSFSGLFYTLSNVGLLGLALVFVLWKKIIKRFTSNGSYIFPIFLLCLFFIPFGSINDFLCSLPTICIILGTSNFLNKKRSFLNPIETKKQHCVIHETSI
jgi:hypothetical protein